MTFLWKYIFPTVWISGFGFGTIALWLAPHTGGRCCAPAEVRWQFLIAWLIATLILLAFPGRLKKVRVDDTTLYVSNYWKRIELPLAEIAAVTEWLPWSTVKVTFRSRTIFGMSIIFAPRIDFYWPWQYHPAIHQLRRLAGLEIGGESPK
jgi:hypothetical protein